MLALVAQAAPAMPQPSSKISTWFSTAFTTPTRAVVMTVARGRDTPLKNPSSAHSATPSGAPSMRGHQYSSASRSTAGSRPKGASRVPPCQPTTANSGSVAAAPHSPTQVAWPARQRRPAPSCWATKVCTPRPTPPTSITKKNTSQKIAAMPAIAVVEMWPTNQVSVRLITACRLLLTISGSASAAIAR